MRRGSVPLSMIAEQSFHTAIGLMLGKSIVRKQGEGTVRASNICVSEEIKLHSSAEALKRIIGTYAELGPKSTDTSRDCKKPRGNLMRVTKRNLT
jgi:hypothetical protein